MLLYPSYITLLFTTIYHNRKENAQSRLSSMIRKWSEPHTLYSCRAPTIKYHPYSVAFDIPEVPVLRLRLCMSSKENTTKLVFIHRNRLAVLMEKKCYLVCRNHKIKIFYLSSPGTGRQSSRTEKLAWNLHRISGHCYRVIAHRYCRYHRHAKWVGKLDIEQFIVTWYSISNGIVHNNTKQF